MTNTLTGEIFCGANVFVFEVRCHFIKERPNTLTILHHIPRICENLIYFEPISCLNDLDLGGTFEKQMVCYIWRT